MSTVIVTGGAGYIGSHTCVELHAAGYDVVVVDDLRNAQAESLRRIERISGRAVDFRRVDVSNEAELARIFESRRDIAGVIHFAGLKSVGDSVSQPLEYFSVNLGSTLSLVRCMDRAGCRNLVRHSGIAPMVAQRWLWCLLAVTRWAPTNTTMKSRHMQ